MIYYLDDVDYQCHCTSVIPESVNTKRGLPTTHDLAMGRKVILTDATLRVYSVS